MQNWFKLPEAERLSIINDVSYEDGLHPVAIEKDWWVVIALRAIFETEFSDHLVFKGGTSLSKSWGIIERFSEDIDLAIDRSYFGYDGDLSKKAVTKLRKASCEFASETFREKLLEKLNMIGIKDFELSITEFEDSDTDPIALELKYKSLTEGADYLQPKIIIELSSRSLRNPFGKCDIQSIIGMSNPTAEYADKVISIPSARPTRTFLEKIFLLHEEFQKPKDRKIRSHRMTRHLYDLSKILDTKFAQEALDDQELYDEIVKHREMLNKISWVDYNLHGAETIDFIPPQSEIDEWRKDYLAMQESMFYGKSESFEELIEKLSTLKNKLNK